MLRQAQHDVLIESALPFQRTFLRNAAGAVEYVNHPQPDIPHPEVGRPITPTYR